MVTGWNGVGLSTQELAVRVRKTRAIASKYGLADACVQWISLHFRSAIQYARAAPHRGDLAVTDFVLSWRAGLWTTAKTIFLEDGLRRARPGRPELAWDDLLLSLKNHRNISKHTKVENMFINIMKECSNAV